MEKLNNWFQRLTQHQRIILLIVFLGVIYFIWSSIWGGVYAARDVELQTQKRSIQEKITTIKQTEQRLTAAARDPQIGELKKQLQAIDLQLKKANRNIISAHQMLIQLNGMFLHDSGITLRRVEDQGVIPFKDSSTPDGNNKTALPLYQHNFIIEFSGNYFSTIHYLKQLQKLPWQLYFDSIDYQVTKYPEADVIIHVHTLSLDESLINV